MPCPTQHEHPSNQEGEDPKDHHTEMFDSGAGGIDTGDLFDLDPRCLFIITIIFQSISSS